MSKCECFENVRKKVEEEYTGKKELKVDWQNRVLWFNNNKDNPPVSLYIDIEYREVRTNGEMYKNKTKDSIGMKLNFCPLCGREYGK